MSKIGIVYIAYSRLDKIRETFSALLDCEGIETCDIHVFSDAPANVKAEPVIADVRDYLESRANENAALSIQIHEREENYGSFRNISEGMKWVAERYDYVLLVEEDVLVNPKFISYSEMVLDKYSDNNSIIGVSAYNPVKALNMVTDIFYSDRFCCYGLGMKSSVIKNLCWDIEKLDLNRINKEQFNWVAKDLSACFQDDLKGKRYFQTSWDVIIFYNMLINRQKEIMPRISLCTNIGFDGSGEWSTTNSFKNDNYQEKYGEEMDLSAISELSEKDEKIFISGFVQDTSKKMILRIGRRVASALHLEKYAKSIKRIFK